MENLITKAQGVPPEGIRQKCPDCLYCQMCSKARCRGCQDIGKERNARNLEPGFTYGDYLVWRRKREE